MRILKFGGKSLDTIQKVQNICKFIKKIYKNDKKIIIIVSAMGKETDKLIDLANQFSDSNPTKRELAKLLATGETQSSALFAMMLESINVPAKSFGAYELGIKTFGDLTDSRIAFINKSKLEETISTNTVCVVAGFQGINSNNEITTLGRGGSDTTAAAIASLFNVDVEIYSDFDGIFSGDPRNFDYKKIKAIDYDSMIDMAKSGAKVLDFRATEIAKNFNFQILSKSSSQPNNSGSIVKEIESDFVSISTINYLSQINIIFSDKSKTTLIVKNILNILNNITYYNLELNSNKLSFFVKSTDKLQVECEIAKKLKLLKYKAY